MQENTRGSSDPNAIAEMHFAMEELHCQNQNLENNVLNIQQCQQETTPTKEMKLQDLQPLSDKIWEAPVHEGFKPLPLAKFDGCSDPYEHVASINMQMTIIGESDYLKCKLLSKNFRDASL